MSRAVPWWLRGTIAASLLIAFAGSAHGAAQTIIPERPSCARCSVSTAVVTTLGAEEGPGALPGNVAHVAADNRGRFWVFTFNELPLVFDANGRFLRVFGRKGDGPGELRNPTRLLLLPGDSLAVLESRPQAHIFDADLRFRRSTAVLPAITSTHIVEWPKRVVVSVTSFSSHRQFPLHVLDLSGPALQRTASFGPHGEIDATSGFVSMMQLFQHITPAVNGGFWTAPFGSYQLTEWDRTNRNMHTLGRRPAWFPPESSGRQGSRDTPPSPRLVGMYQDQRGYIWIAAHVAAETFRDAWANVSPNPQRGGGEVSASAEPDRELLYDTQVEIIDPWNKRLVAGTRIKGYALGLLTDGRLAMLASTASGAARVRIVSLNLIES